MILSIAIAAAVAFPIAMILKKKGHRRPSELVGIAFHLLLFPIVAHLSAPEWVRAAGYTWLAIDTMIGVAALNDMNEDSVWQIRLGGHVLAGVWIFFTASEATGFIFWLGLPLAINLGGYSLVAPWADRRYIAPSMFLMIAWLIAIAVH